VADAEDQTRAKVKVIPEDDRVHIPKLVRAMQLNSRCKKDEWLPK
jgi:hypothetical protein